MEFHDAHAAAFDGAPFVESSVSDPRASWRFNGQNLAQLITRRAVSQRFMADLGLKPILSDRVDTFSRWATVFFDPHHSSARCWTCTVSLMMGSEDPVAALGVMHAGVRSHLVEVYMTHRHGHISARLFSGGSRMPEQRAPVNSKKGLEWGGSSTGDGLETLSEGSLGGHVAAYLSAVDSVLESMSPARLHGTGRVYSNIEPLDRRGATTSETPEALTWLDCLGAGFTHLAACEAEYVFDATRAEVLPEERD